MTILEKEFLRLEAKYSNAPVALDALCRAAEVSSAYLDFIVTELSDTLAPPHKPFKATSDYKKHALRHKNDSATLVKLSKRITALEEKG